MSTENIAKFQEAVAASPELQTKLQAIAADTAESRAAQVAALSVEAGLPFAADELLREARAGELSDEQLEDVAGGYRPRVHATPGVAAVSFLSVGYGCMIWAVVSASKNDGDAKACMNV